MKKFLTISFISLVLLYGEPYRPYPIIFLHGYAGSSKGFGVPTVDRGDEIPWDSVQKYPDKIYYKYLQKMNSYCYVWDKIDSTFSKPGDDTLPGEPIPYPNKSFIEVISFDEPVGSVDPEEDEWAIGNAYKMVDKEVLR